MQLQQEAVLKAGSQNLFDVRRDEGRRNGEFDAAGMFFQGDDENVSQLCFLSFWLAKGIVVHALGFCHGVVGGATCSWPGLERFKQFVILGDTATGTCIYARLNSLNQCFHV